MGHYKALFFLVICLVSLYRANGQLDDCSEQGPCLTFTEGSCIGGSRMVCLGQNAAATGCTLGAGMSFNSICALVGGASPSVSSTCSVYAGGTTAQFAVQDGGTATGSSTFPVPIAGSTTATRSGTCAAQSTVLCPGAGAGTNTIWSFAVTSCDCNCNVWSNWGSCQASCTRSRSRTCTPPSSDVSCTANQTETSACTGDQCLGCSCEPNWSQWSTCSSTCRGGISTRRRRCVAVTAGSTCEDITEERSCSSTADCVDNSRFRCHCGGWTGWSSCSSSCNSGSQSRTRSCAPIPGGPPLGMCPEVYFPTTMTRSCMGNNPTCPPTTTSPAPTPAPPTGCSCFPWSAWSSCSATCGVGSRTRSRSCRSQCPLVTYPRVMTGFCNTGIMCGGPFNPVPPPAGCTCGAWQSGGCSVSCGGGSRIETRICNPTFCDRITRLVSCGNAPCGRLGGGRRGGGRRGGRRRRPCNRIRRPAARRRCMRRRG